MSAQTMADAWAPVDRHYKEQIFRETWGHLAPKRNKSYPGTITFAVGCYGSNDLNPTILSSTFDLQDSPWFFDAMDDFVRDNRGEAGNVYHFDGAFRNYKFQGKIRLVYASESGGAPHGR